MNCPLNSEERRVPSDDTPRTPRIAHHASRITPLASRPSPLRLAQAAFSLVEVMIACGIFFMAIFSILALISGVLRNARSLRRVELDAGMVAAQVSNTNKLTEGTQSGDFANLYPGYSWEADQYEVATNGLWQVDIVVRRQGLPQPVDVMSIWLYRPQSQSGFGRPNIK
jgi:Tfp pilus assembly protein PilV